MSNRKKIVLLVGGVGGAKLAYGLAHIVPSEDLTIIVNTADDFWLYGLRICPDLDTVTYTLSGRVDKVNGWGVAAETTTTLDTLRALGDEAWFRLGDKDLATHLLRTRLWHEGRTLTEITRHLTQAMGIQCTILPMADSPIATMVDTVEHGVLAFQDYFVRHRWQPTVKALKLEGAVDAVMTEAVRKAITEADAIFIGPSNPWLSIQPILSVPGLRELIESRPVPRIAVTPIVAGNALKGPAAKLMGELGYEVTVKSVADYYAPVINGFVYDERDSDFSLVSMRKIALDTIMDSEEKRIVLARHLLAWTFAAEQMGS